MPREQQPPTALPVYLEPELFGYREPNAANDKVGDDRIAKLGGYPNSEALEAAIADGTCPEKVESSWVQWRVDTERRHGSNAKVADLLKRGNDLAASVRRLHRRVLDLENDVDWLLAQQPAGEKPPKRRDLDPLERG